MSKEPYGLGVSWLWKLPNTHPFYIAGVAHDIAYENKIGNSSYPYDRIFLETCLKIAKEKKSLSLKAQAYLFYGLARLWGIVRW
jgi:hypothetical protein